MGGEALDAPRRMAGYQELRQMQALTVPGVRASLLKSAQDTDKRRAAGYRHPGTQAPSRDADAP